MEQMKKWLFNGVLYGLAYGTLLLYATTLQAQISQTVLQKNYRVNKGMSVAIDNRYGTVDVLTNNGNELKVTVTIVTKAATQTKAQAVFDNISINVDDRIALNPANPIKFTTQIGKIPNNVDFEVKYKVEIPMYLNINISQKYGAVYMANHSGESNINIAYGTFVGEALTNAKNILILAYSDGGLEQWGGQDLTLKYSKLRLGTANTLNCLLSYSKCEIEEVQEVLGNIRYSELKLGKVGSLRGTSAYSGVQIKQLLKILALEAKYNSALSVTEINSGFELVELLLQYTNSQLNFASGSGYEFDVVLKYGSLGGNTSQWKFNQKIVQDYTSTYKGVFGNGKAQLKIDAKYGNIKIEQR
jgi:hypothetical protein